MARIALAALAVGGGVAGSILTGGTLGNALLFAGGTAAQAILAGRNKDRERRAAVARQLLTAPVVPAQWVLGRQRKAGALFFGEESPVIPAAPIDVGRDLPPLAEAALPVLRPARVLYLGVILADGEIDGVEKLWIDGVEVPYRDTDGVLAVDTSAFNAELAVLRQRVAELAGPEIDNDPVAEALKGDLQAQIRDLEAAAKGPPWFEAEFDGDGYGPAVRIGLDLGGPGTSAADLMARAASALMADLADLDGEPAFEWTAAHRVEGLAWAWVEIRNFRDPDGNSVPWTTVPRIEFLVRGVRVAGAWTDDPATLVHWYLTERCGVNVLDVLGVPEASAVCRTPVTIPVPTRTSELGRAWLEAAYGPPSGWPAPGVQNAFVAELAARYAGPVNARPRYSFNGLVDGDEDRGSVLAALAAAMAGDVIDVGGQYQVTAGAATPPAGIIEQDDLLAAGEWVLSPPDQDRVNVLVGALAQDRHREWTENTLPEVADQALVDAEGRFERDVGYVPGAADEITARRLLATTLRKLSPTLNRLTIPVAPGANFRWWALNAGDRVALDWPHEGVTPATLWRIEAALPTLDGAVLLSLVEEPADTYEDDLAQTFGDLWRDRRSTTPRTPAPGVPATAVIGVTADGFESTVQLFQLGLISVEVRVVKLYNLRATGVPEDVEVKLVWKRENQPWNEVTVTGGNATPHVERTEDGKGFNMTFLVPEGLIDSARAIRILFAVRTGTAEDHEEDPYVYHGRFKLTLTPEPVPLTESNRRVTQEPTEESTAGDRPGTQYSEPFPEDSG